jgi:RNA polymerase subunit RPABC4/transcription elongation factor Spt4
MTNPSTVVRKNVELTGNSLEELQRFKEGFAAELKLNRASERRFALPILMIFLAGFAAIFCSFLLFHPPLTWLFITGFVMVAIALILMAVTATVYQRKLICPACRHSFMDAIDECCPECGSPSLEMRDWRGGRHCNFCGKDLVSGKNRNFKYKACTHCGVLLDEKGL